MSERAGSLLRAVCALAGVSLLVCGGVGIWFSAKLFWFVLTHTADSQYPFTAPALVNRGAWLAIALALFFAGASLVVSAVRARRRNLIAGPTLYVLGLGLAVAGAHLLTHGSIGPGLTGIALGLAVIWWEWAFEIS